MPQPARPVLRLGPAMSEKGELDLTGAKQNTGMWLVKVRKPPVLVPGTGLWRPGLPCRPRSAVPGVAVAGPGVEAGR